MSSPIRINVKALPIHEVIKDMAKCMNTKFKSTCEVYSLTIPKDLGKGEIKGVQYNSGLGLIFYSFELKTDVEIHFVKSDIHPAKFLYSQGGEVQHFFAEDPAAHLLPAYKSIIVASSGKGGHVLRFSKDVKYKLSSLEIDRKRFLQEASCSLEKVDSPLILLLSDIKATNRFYHEGQYSLEFDQIIDQIDNFPHEGISRLLFMQAKSAEMLTLQVLDYEDDLREGSAQVRLRHSEIGKIREAQEYIALHLASEITVTGIAKQVATNENKLQHGFKSLTGSTVAEYIKKARLEKARNLIVHTDLTISEIVFKVGWENRGHFSKLFKEAYGHLPTAYRRLNGL